MKRRSVLLRLCGGGLIGLSGCVRPPKSSLQSTDSPPTDSPAGELQRRISLDEQITVPEEVKLQITPTVLEPTITDSHTARIQVTITNTGPAREIQASTGHCALINRNSQASNPRGIWLGLADDDSYVTQTGPRWVAEPPENGAFADYGCRLRTYESGESVSVDYGIFHDDRARGYLNSGTYRFVADDILISPTPSAEGDADASITVNWGFSIRINNPNCTLCL